MLGAAAGRENVGRLLPVDDISCQNMPRDEINRYIVGRLDTKVEVVFASRRDNKASLCSYSGSRHRYNVAGPSKQFNHFDMHTRYDPGGFMNSQRGRDGPGSQSDRAKDGRDSDRCRERQIQRER